MAFEPFQFRDDFLSVLRLDMGHQNGERGSSEFIRLLSQGSGCEMTAHIGNILESVGEGGLEHHGTEVFLSSRHAPDLFRRPRVSYEKQSLFVVFNKKGHTGDDVIDPDRCYG